MSATVSSAPPADVLPMPLALAGHGETVLQQALSAYLGKLDEAAALLPATAGLLRHYDVPAMQEAVAVCFWGRSGSHLLASYLDGHDDLVLMPENRGEAIYEFCEKFPWLTLWEKLVVYPTFVGSKTWGAGAEFFAGDFPIGAAHYYAAVQALHAAYGDRPIDWLERRQRFVQFVHVAYAVAAGRRPATATPLIIYAQHFPDEERAQEFITDFPAGRFLHTIRDPISGLDSWFDRQIDMQSARRGNRLELAGSYIDPGFETFRYLTRWDQPHAGMAARTRAVRFEDLHLAPEVTLRRVAQWLGVPFRPCLLESTFNGAPFVWRAEGGSWVGARPANATRRSLNLTTIDRWLMFAVLQGNFLQWGYPLPRPFRSRRLCLLVSALLLWLPTRMERRNARLILRRQALPAWRAGRRRFALGAAAFLLRLRGRMMWRIAGEVRARLIRRASLLQPL